VGWANSSLRFLHQLPLLPESLRKKAKGVVREDPLGAAFDSGLSHQGQREPQGATGSGDVPVRGASASASGGGSAAGGSGASTVVSLAVEASAEAMLVRLQALSWRRVDVSFKGAMFGFAHNNIQVRAGRAGPSWAWLPGHVSHVGWASGKGALARQFAPTAVHLSTPIGTAGSGTLRKRRTPGLTNRVDGIRAQETEAGSHHCPSPPPAGDAALHEL
jgi:hypothetical protein